MQDTVIVTGASSQLGVFLLPRLQEAGFRVLAYSRRSPESPVDVSNGVCWVQPGHAAGPAGYMVSCGPLDLACSMVARQPEVRRVVAFSTSSVLTKAESENRGENLQMAKILRAEERLSVLCAEREIALALVRPTLIYGCGLDRNISLMARVGRRFGFIPVASEAAGLRQPVHADDLAALAVSYLLSVTMPGLESVACGGSTLSYREMMEKTAAACGPGTRTLTLNTHILTTAARAVSFLPGLRGVNAEMVRRQGQDMTFDDSVLRAALGYDPRPFQPGPGDLEIPDFAAELQLSR